MVAALRPLCSCAHSFLRHSPACGKCDCTRYQRPGPAPARALPVTPVAGSREFVTRGRLDGTSWGGLKLADPDKWAHTVRTLRLTPAGEREALLQSVRRILTKVHPGCEGLR